MECMVFPLEKAQIGGITINLGMKKEDVHKLLGNPEFVNREDDGSERHYYLQQSVLE